MGERAAQGGTGEEAASGQLPDCAARRLDGVELDVDPRRTTRGTRPQRRGPREECPPHEPQGSLAGAEASEQTVHSQAGSKFSPGDEEGTTVWAASKQGPISLLPHALLQPRERLYSFPGLQSGLPCLHLVSLIYTLVSLIYTLVSPDLHSSLPDLHSSLPVYTLVSLIYTLVSLSTL